MTKNQCMVDLETLDVISTAAILSIGAVAFDEDMNEIDEFYIVVNTQSCIDAGMTTNAETLKWWMSKSKDARSVLSEARHTDTSITDGLQEFANWIDENDVTYVWGNGADFDNAMLACAYDSCKLPFPWKYYNNRCYRTIKNMFSDVKMDRTGTFHNALDDARSQFQHLAAMFAAE